MRDMLRIAAIADIHVKKSSAGTLQPLFSKGNAPVYNVAMPVLATAFPNKPPFRVVEVPVGEPAGAVSVRS